MTANVPAIILGIKIGRAGEVVTRHYPPPILTLFLTGSAPISALIQKANTKTEIRLKTETYHPRKKIMAGGSALCSPVPTFPGTYVPRTYVPRYLCSPVPMFPGTDVPRTYVPRYLCSPVPMFPEPMFPSTYVPRFTANVL